MEVIYLVFPLVLRIHSVLVPLSYQGDKYDKILPHHTTPCFQVLLVAVIVYAKYTLYYSTRNFQKYPPIKLPIRQISDDYLKSSLIPLLITKNLYHSSSSATTFHVTHLPQLLPPLLRSAKFHIHSRTEVPYLHLPCDISSDYPRLLFPTYDS